MIVNPDNLIEITINDKKFWLDEKNSTERMITQRVCSKFKDIHNYTIGDDNTTDEDIVEMVSCLNIFNRSAADDVHQLVIEFIDKYYDNPEQVYMRLLGDKYVIAVYKYFRYGPHHSEYNVDDLFEGMQMMRDDIITLELPEFSLLANSSKNLLQYIVAIDTDGIHLTNYQILPIIPGDSFAKSLTEKDFWSIQRCSILFLMYLKYFGVTLFSGKYGSVLSEKLFSPESFDISAWIYKEPQEKQRKKSKKKVIVEDSDDEEY